MTLFCEHEWEDDPQGHADGYKISLLCRKCNTIVRRNPVPAPLSGIISETLTDDSIVYNVMLRVTNHPGDWVVLTCEDKEHAERLSQELNKCLSVEY